MRRSLTAVTWPLAALVVVGVALRLAGMDRVVWGGQALLVQALAFYPYAIAAAAVLVALLWLGTRRLAAGVATAAVLVGLAPVVLRGVALVTYDDSDDSDAVTVATLNLLFGRADAAEVVALATEVDALALQELTPEALAGLEAAGLDDELPHRVVDPRPGAAGSGIWARHPLAAGDPVPGTFAMPGAVMAHPDREGFAVGLTNVHPVPPVDGAIPTWGAELGRIAEGDLGVIVLGDFNATLDHAAMRAVLGSGYTDVAAATGDGLRASWPAVGSALPGVVIDHVLVGAGAGASSTRVVEVAGTDHRAVVARVIVPLR